MAKGQFPTAKEKLNKLAVVLAQDAKKEPDQRRYPDQALPALHDERVQKALAKSINDSAEVTGAFELGYEPAIETSYIFFSISEDPRKISSSGVLCLVDGFCGVMSVKNDFTIPQEGAFARLPTGRPALSSPFVFTQQLQAAPIMFGRTPGPGLPDGPGWDWPPDKGRIPIDELVDGKHETRCQVCKPVWCWMPVPPGGSVRVQDDVFCTNEADDCGNDSLFSSTLSFAF